MQVTNKQFNNNKMILKLEKARIDNWTQRKFFEGTSAKLGPAIDQTGYPVTGLKDAAEERKFEKVLGLPEKSLARTSDYWNDFVIVVDINGVMLDDSLPEHQLQLKFLRAQSIVAEGTAGLMTRPKAEYVLKNEEEEKVQKNKGRRLLNNARKRVGNMGPAELKGLVLMYGHSPDNMTPDAIEDFVFDKVEEDPKTFNLIVDDPGREAKVFVHALNKAEILELKAGAYMYNGEVIAYGLDATAHLLKDKKKQELRIALEKQLADK